jgi:HSP20 family molecular chaperone IbpA
MVKLPSSANPDKIEAKFKNGILTVTIAKDGEEERNVRKIKVGQEA